MEMSGRPTLLPPHTLRTPPAHRTPPVRPRRVTRWCLHMCSAAPGRRARVFACARRCASCAAAHGDEEEGAQDRVEEGEGVGGDGGDDDAGEVEQDEQQLNDVRRRGEESVA